MNAWRAAVRRFRTVGSNDDGAVMIIAILIITVVALVTTAILTRGDGSLRATVKLRQVAGSSYAADAAAQVVLNDLRTGYWAGNAPKPTGWVYTNEVQDGCFGRDDINSILEPDSDLLLPSFYPAPKSSGAAPTSAYVVCTPEDATGAQGTARIVTDANSPGDAIIITGSSGAEDGLHSESKPLTVRGGVRVRSNIYSKKNNPQGVQVNDANVSARSCNNAANIGVSTGFTLNCSASFSGAPSYSPDVSTIPDLAPAPTCDATSLTFTAGYYDDVSVLTSAVSSCGKNLWFKPGTYYFDFHNNGAANADPLYNSAIAGNVGNVWTIAGRSVVGGTPIDNAKNPLAALPANPAIGKACQNPIDSVNATGVQFLFGGDSRMAFGQDARVELCATYRKTTPPIVYFQNLTGSNPTLSSLTGTTGPSAGLTASGAVTQAAGPGGTEPAVFAPLDAASLKDDGNGVPTWTRGASSGTNGNETRTITMNGFAPPSTIPRGAVLKDARLVVRHKSAGTGGSNPASTLAITPTATGASALPTITLAKQASLTTQTITLKSDQLAVYNALAKSIHDYGYTGAGMKFTATANRGQSVALDAIRLELDYYVPRLRSGSAITGNCVTTVNGCYILNTDNKAEVYLQGTTYVPDGKINLTVANTQGQVFRWGVIARAIYADLNGAAPPGALIELPDNSIGYGLDGTIVQLKVYVCPNAATCSASGRLALKVRAEIWDVDGNAATTTDRRVTVLSWSHQS